jgi:general secretion pathway protein I
MRTGNSRAGFTLLEVMVALAIIGIALVALLTTQSTSIKIITRSTLLTKSYLLGEKKLAALELAGYDAADDGEGSFEENPELRWVQTVSETEIEGLKEVHLRIISGEPEKERREADFVTFVSQMESPEDEDEQ